MAGVISRSAYLEARTPAEDEEKGKKKKRYFVENCGLGQN